MKRLSDLQGTWVPSPRLQTQNLVPPECHHPALPTDLQPICTTREAASIFKALSEYPHPYQRPGPRSLSSPYSSSCSLVSPQGTGGSRSSAPDLPCLGTAPYPSPQRPRPLVVLVDFPDGREGDSRQLTCKQGLHYSGGQGGTESGRLPRGGDI